MQTVVRFIGFSIFILVVTACSHRSYSPPCQYVYNSNDVMAQAYVHKYGMAVPEEEWSDRGKNGKIVSTLKSGVVVTNNYQDGYLDGETTYTFPHSGAIHRIEKYDLGQLIAEQELFPTGNVKRDVQFDRPNQKTVTEWSENGAARFREHYCDNKLLDADYYNENGQVECKIDEGTGLRINRDPFGQKISQDKFQYGECVLRTTFWPNEGPKEIIPLKEDRNHGQLKTFLPGGEPRTIESWVDGEQEGITVVFQNGEKIAEVPYLRGEKNGEELRFKDGRFLVEKLNWKNGKKHGPCCAYLGEDTHMTWFYEGREVSKRQYEKMLHPVSR